MRRELTFVYMRWGLDLVLADVLIQYHLWTGHPRAQIQTFKVLGLPL